MEYEKVLSSAIKNVFPVLDPKTLVFFDKTLEGLPSLDSALAIADAMTLEDFFASIQPRKQIKK